MGRNKSWTEEELEYMEDSWGIISIPTMAKNLNRSIQAIQIKANRIGLTRHLHSGSLITFFQLCEAIGKKRSYQWLKKQWVKAGLPIKYQKVIKKRYAMVDIDEFWDWAEQHKELIDFSVFEENILGLEPQWVKELRKGPGVYNTNYKVWSAAEDEKLKRMLLQYKYTYDDLRKEFDRSYSSIKSRIIRLNLKERPIRNYEKQWQDDEIEILLSMKNDGYCFDEIGRRLKRSSDAVRGKYERLQCPELSKRWYAKMRKEGKIA